jgi:PEP-CTERM motif
LAEDISLTRAGGNLLGVTWNFTPFDPLDTVDAGQFNDGFGSGTNGLFLANGTGSLDRFDQAVTTVVGQSYTLHFLFINNPLGDGANDGPSELLVSASNTVPEPGSLILMGLGLLGIGFFGRRRLAL